MLAVLLTLFSAQVDAPTITLTGPSCGACRIVKHVVAEFGKDAAGQEAAPDGLMGVIAVGNAFLGIVQAQKAVPVVFGADGKVIRVLGRSGGGPGEFAGPGLVSTWRGDSVLISDPTAGRISVFDRQWKFGRTIPFPSIETWVALNGGLLVGGMTHDPGSRDLLRVFDASGRQLVSFGAGTPADSLSGSMSGPPLLTTDGQRVWSVPFIGTYRISEWDLSTRRRARILLRKGPDFAEKQELAEMSPTTPPRGHIRGFYRDGPLLWVFYAVADRQWARGLVQAEMQSRTGKVKYWKSERPDQVFDTIVEAIDIATGKLLASQTFEELFTALAPTGALALHKVETATGESVSQVLRFELRR